MVHIDEARCTGCGTCVSVCPTGAIRLVEGVARIEQTLCRECEACLSACPDGAILALREPVKTWKLTPLRGVPVPTPAPARPVARVPRPGGVRSWASAARAFIGHEVMFRASALLGSRGQWQHWPASPFRAPAVPGRVNRHGWGGGRRTRRRRRGRW